MNGQARFDLHVHTIYSYDSLMEPDLVVKFAIRTGLSGLAITDHDTVEGVRRLMETGVDNDFIVIPGIEISSDRGHLLLLNIDYTSFNIPSHNFYEIIDYARDIDAIVIIPHPLDIFRRFKNLNEGIKYVEAIEVANSSDIFLKKNFRKLINLAARHGLAYTAGSDAHIYEAIGTSHIIVNEEVECVDELIKLIRMKRVNIHLGRTPIIHRLRKLFQQYLPLSK